ncbi:MAG: 2-oxo acid dehydrogenase subunit E2 [Caldilineaceae bacterium]|nr:2-oxo acid dehydrogenase subunit E2 [Caldilineaceae bacterium]
MATPIIMPKQGNTVESCIIVAWKKAVGDPVAVDDVLCEIETDKATMEVVSPESGTLLAILHEAGEEVPVLENIAVVGAPGEDVSEWGAASEAASSAEAQPAATPLAAAVAPPVQPSGAAGEAGAAGPVGISPRARGLAARRGIDASSLVGTGPQGRVIERDVQAAIVAQPKLTPVARAMVAEGGFRVPAQGSGPGGRITSRDLRVEAQQATAAAPAPAPMPVPSQVLDRQAATAGEVEVIPVKGVRKIIAERMLQSLQTTAQLTLNSSADARALQAYRRRLKESPEALGLRGITINDLILFAVARTLPAFPALNALFSGEEIHHYRRVHLGVAVDTPKGLMVPVVRGADTMSLREISAEAKRLATACLDGKVMPDELTGGTFTVTNLGAFGVESFTPVLNPPQVAILGVCNIQPKAVEVGGEIQFVPHIGLSLTINHQVVDGAPAARFLQALGQSVAQIDLMLAG